MLPGGMVVIAGQKYDALSNGLAIERDQVVQVIEVRTNRIIVRPSDGAIDAVEAMAAGTGPNESPIEGAETADDVLSTPVESLGLDDLSDPLA
jgi:hypothetical protein